MISSSEERPQDRYPEIYTSVHEAVLREVKKFEGKPLHINMLKHLKDTIPRLRPFYLLPEHEQKVLLKVIEKAFIKGFGKEIFHQ